jgi:hypothetical protein
MAADAPPTWVLRGQLRTVCDGDAALLMDRMHAAAGASA